MIRREFDNWKFTRTYIGGSKKRENEIFIEVQGTKEDNSECNWLEYRRLFMQYCDDVLNIIVSWRDVLGKLRIVFAVLALLISILSIDVGIFFILLATISHAMHWHLKCLELKKMSEYNFSLDVINQETGLTLSKN
jgi:hypothetical protein